MYLTPEKISAALEHPRANTTALELVAVLERLACTRSPVPGSPDCANVYTSSGALVFSGTDEHTWAWLLNSSPACTFAELSPMRRDRLVAAFVSPGRDLLGGVRKFAAEHGGAHGAEHGFNAYPDADHVAGIWSFARHAGWSYLETLESPAAVASEALGLWQSQVPGDDRDDPGAYEY